jgi:hypothetical protein
MVKRIALSKEKTRPLLGNGKDKQENQARALLQKIEKLQKAVAQLKTLVDRKEFDAFRGKDMAK